MPEVHHKDDFKVPTGQAILNGSRITITASALPRADYPRGEKHGNAKLTDAQATEIKWLYARGVNQSNRGNTTLLATQFGVSAVGIRKVVAFKALETY